MLKFDSRKPVDITTWDKPVKLNRKDFRRNSDNGASGPAAPQAVGPMLGPDGKPVIGMDGRVVMVDADGRPIRTGAAATNGAGDNGKGKEKVSAAKKKFQKKTKQVFLVPDAVRRLRREERYPWVMEDSSSTEVWVGSMEEVSKAETQAMFMPAANDIFKFVPAHRWYKFQKKPNYHIPNLEEAESLVNIIACLVYHTFYIVASRCLKLRRTRTLNGGYFVKGMVRAPRKPRRLCSSLNAKAALYPPDRRSFIQQVRVTALVDEDYVP